MTITATQTTQVYQVFIKATPEAIWDAITKPEFTERYFYGARIQNSAERHQSLGPDGSLWGDSPTFEFDPPRRLDDGAQRPEDAARDRRAAGFGLTSPPRGGPSGPLRGLPGRGEEWTSTATRSCC